VYTRRADALQDTLQKRSLKKLMMMDHMGAMRKALLGRLGRVYAAGVCMAAGLMVREG
jgi:hypothetical protein